MRRTRAAADWARELDAELRTGASGERAENERRYLKSELTFYGQPMPAIRSVAKRFLAEQPDLKRTHLVDLVEILWSEAVYERRALAVKLLEARVRLLKADDLPLLERLLRESQTWALVDPLAAGVAGPLLEVVEGATSVLDAWAGDDDLWIRRSALLAHLGPLREGAGDFERFGRYADAMLEEKEFFIRKAIGWVLRDTARKRPDLVYEWIAPRTHRASGVTIREAVKRLDEDARERVLAAYRDRRPTRVA